ncbi:MAG TPA: tRNA pseudouridine(55) synthase TruB [Thiomicrospira sp.]|jgi:tRNA pseudouridine55 synthase|nr:tRNA pseudouridine(55) synthase TruB [Thiomicrospira sp.]
MTTEKPLKKKWKLVNGIVLLDKPAGVTSNGVLQQVRRFYSAKKAGHTGALDPFATGLLPICFGEATKVSGLLLDSDKRYIATLKLGEETDTGDKDGEIIQTLPVEKLTENKLNDALKNFTGEIMQIPPMYSALKHKGKPFYEYARKGITIDRPARPITILSLTLISFSANIIKFEVHCTKGTYVRTLGEDIAKHLNTVGHLIALHRTQLGDITADQMQSLADLSSGSAEYLLPLDLPLQHLTALNLSAEDTSCIQHGGKLQIERPATDLVRFYDDKGVFFGVGEWQVEKELLKPKRLFNL